MKQIKFCLFCAVCSVFLAVPVAVAGGVKTKYVQSDSSTIDFDEAAIQGQMRAPEGFYLQGRKKQSLSQMVKLRSHFKRELKTSSSAVKAFVK